MPDLANLDYVDRVNRAIDHVMAHLATPLRLEDVAGAACFSPYHFHRIFRALMGETLGAFIKRVRLERAVHLLSHRKRATITEIALACGFSSSSDFSRVFRAHYGVPPSRFDVGQVRRAGSDALRATLPTGDRQYRLERVPAGSLDEFAVTVRHLLPRRVAYIRVHRPYEGDHVLQATMRLLAWAEARGLAGGQWLGYQWEDPEVVPLEKCRYDVALEVPDTVRPDGEVSVSTFPACSIAEIEIDGPIDAELRALEWFYRVWLPTSGYAPAHQPMFEAWNGRPFAHGMEHFELRMQVAIVDASIPL